MSTAAISAAASHDQRFSWDTHCGGDFDLVDYVFGRASVSRRLPGGARQRVPSVRSRIRATTSSKSSLSGRARTRPRSRASSTTSRGISAIGRSAIAVAENVAGSARAAPIRADVRRPSTESAKPARCVAARLRGLHVDRRISTSRRATASTARSACTAAATANLSASTRAIAGREHQARRARRSRRPPARPGRRHGAVCRLRARHRRRPARPPARSWAFAGFAAA